MHRSINLIRPQSAALLYAYGENVREPLIFVREPRVFGDWACLPAKASVGCWVDR